MIRSSPAYLRKKKEFDWTTQATLRNQLEHQGNFGRNKAKYRKPLRYEMKVQQRS
jgi:hypothetical protein